MKMDIIAYDMIMQIELRWVRLGPSCGVFCSANCIVSWGSTIQNHARQPPQSRVSL